MVHSVNLCGLMVRLATVLLLCVSVSNAESGAGRLEGHWEGAFVRLGAIQEVHIDFDIEADTLVGTYAIPDLELYREPLREITYRNDTLSFRVIWGTFLCFNHSSVVEITGSNENWNPTVTVHLKRTLKPSTFSVQSVSYNGSGGKIAADLYIPSGKGPFAAMVIVPGSGDQGRANWLYRSHAEVLARNGIAALIYDKPGVGESEGNWSSGDFERRAKDITSAVDFLVRRPRIDGERLGLLGISQGGWLAPLAASKDKRVHFLVLSVAPSVTVWQQESDRVEFTMRSEGYAAPQIKDAMSYIRAYFEAVERNENRGEVLAQAKLLKDSSFASIVPLPETDTDFDGWLEEKFDPAPVLNETRIPTLVLYGENDLLVPPEKNFELMRSLLSQAGNSDFEVVTIPEADHDMTTGSTLIGDEWNWPHAFWRWNRRAPAYFGTIVKWTRERFNRSLRPTNP